AFTVSLLRAWFGEAATQENDFCYDLLPRITGDHSTYPTILGMLDGEVRGFFVLGENPAVGSANSSLHRMAMAKLDWLVVPDLVEIETASFWKDAPEIARGELRTTEIPTEVFLLPAAAHTEKDGSFTNTQRLLQWHHAAVAPAGDRRSELWFFYHLGRLIRSKLAASTDPRDQLLRSLTWDYPTDGPSAEPGAEAVLAELNGRDADGRPLRSFTQLREDGTTACGCWIYCGSYAGAINQTARRRPGAEQTWVAPEWGWAWPANRRLLYNRASADPAGQPWSERKRYVWWDEAAGRWAGERLGGRGGRGAGGGGRAPPSASTWRPATGRRLRPSPSWRCAETSRSSCSRTAVAGCSRPAGCAMGRCRRTTSRRSRPSRIHSTK